MTMLDVVAGGTRRAVKLGALAAGVLCGRRPSGISFLIYHSVTGGTRLELDTPFPHFELQVAYLAERGGVIAYEEAIAQLRSGSEAAPGRFVLTFDDGFEDTARLVFPLVREHGIPITIFVTTGLLERDVAVLKAWSHEEKLPSMTWDDLGRMHESGLVTIGAHTHSHRDLDGLDEGEIEDEIERSQELFKIRIGFEPIHFAYPRAKWSERAEGVVRRHYDTAVLAGGRAATAAGFNPYRIPRVPIRRSDGVFFFKAKIRGFLAAEETIYARLRALR